MVFEHVLNYGKDERKIWEKLEEDEAAGHFHDSGNSMTKEF